jgi:hypothetical protein
VLFLYDYRFVVDANLATQALGCLSRLAVLLGFLFESLPTPGQFFLGNHMPCAQIDHASTDERCKSDDHPHKRCREPSKHARHQ